LLAEEFRIEARGHSDGGSHTSLAHPNLLPIRTNLNLLLLLPHNVLHTRLVAPYNIHRQGIASSSVVSRHRNAVAVVIRRLVNARSHTAAQIALLRSRAPLLLRLRLRRGTVTSAAPAPHVALCPTWHAERKRADPSRDTTQRTVRLRPRRRENATAQQLDCFFYFTSNALTKMSP
jgi:hypothetical protein